jgi:hypothetical protein
MRSTQHPPRRHRSEDEASPVDTSTICIEDVDGLLEEIDTLLEDQAVLTNFRQRSGQ